MLRLGEINLDTDPGLIQPPQVEGNTVVIRLVADKQDIVTADIIDVALSYSIAGIDVILEIPFIDRARFNNQQLASLVCNGGWSLSLLPPSSSIDSVGMEEYSAHIIVWYQIWRSKTMSNFEKTIYPITPYLEYLATNYLIEKNKEGLDSKSKKELELLSQNPNDTYLVEFIDNMQIRYVDGFKQQLESFIKESDQDFYRDIDLLSEPNSKTKCQI